MRSLAELDASLDVIRASPRERGTVELIVRRAAVDEREIVETCELDVARGLVGDSWISRWNRHTPDGSPNLAQQLTLMSTRAIAALAERERWALAGDQLFVDFDLSAAALPVGTLLSVGTARIEVSAQPHLGCAKFTARYGSNATKWVNSESGKLLRLRGINARVVQSGIVRRGDAISRA